MNKKVIGWLYFILIVLMSLHPEWFTKQTTQAWLSIIAMLIALGYITD